MLQVLTDEEHMALVIRNSYRAFHSLGVDYVCLSRNNDLTVKAYFFDEGTPEHPEVVNPHNHRYDFATEILHGGLDNLLWTEHEAGHATRRDHFFEFDYYSPLNDGDGFHLMRELYLEPGEQRRYETGERYLMDYRQIHTLANVRAGTVMLLWQYRDINSPRVPSQTYSKEAEAPSLEGLYLKHTPDQIRERLLQLEDLRPGILQEYALHHFANVNFMPPDLSDGLGHPR